LSFTFAVSAAALTVSGIGFLIFPLTQLSITPFTLLLHLVWAISASAWILSLRINTRPERRAFLAIGIVVALGSAWSSLQQWLAYQQTGMVNDLIFVLGAMMMDVAGGAITYIIYSFNALRGRTRPIRPN
jgi:hypothetical protein